MDHSRYTIFGIEKPFPWVPLLVWTGLAGVGFTGGVGIVLGALYLGFGSDCR